MKKYFLQTVFIFISLGAAAQYTPRVKTEYDSIHKHILAGEKGRDLILKLDQYPPKTTADSAYSLNLRGAFYAAHGKLDSALNNYEASVSLFRRTTFKKETASALNDVGNVSLNTNDMEKALAVFQEALKIYEEIHEVASAAGPLYNMGIVYYDMGDLDRCEKYTRQAIPMNIKSGNNKWLLRNYSQLGQVFMNRKNKDSALKYSFTALDISKKCGDSKLLGFSYQGTGITYAQFGDLTHAKFYFDSALAVRLKNDDQVELIGSYGALGELMMGLNRPDEAKKYVLRALKISEEKKFLRYMNNCYRVLFSLEELLGNYKEAYNYHKLFTQTEDSMHNENRTRTLIDKEYKFDFEKKEAAIKTENEKQKIITEEEKKSQKIITYGISLGLLLVAMAAILMFRSSRIRKRANKELSEKNELIVKQQKETETQRQLLAEKQKEVIDSILYAKRIQQALITSEIYIARVLDKMNKA